MSDDNPITFANPTDTVKFYRGMTITFPAPWWKRLWRWFKYRVLRRPRPMLTVTKVDHKAGEVTVEAWTELP